MGNGPVAADELRLLIERVERIEEEIKAAQDDRKDVYGEAKSRGFCPKTMKRIVKERKKSLDQRREEEAMYDIYAGALGMLDGTPLGTWAVDKLAKAKKPATADDAAKAGASDPVEAKPEEPVVTIGDARRAGTEAARAGQPVTANPYPPRSPLRAAWDEAWCHELGSDGMDIPEALRPASKGKAAAEAQPTPEAEAEAGEDDDDESALVIATPGDADPLYADARAKVIADQYVSVSRIQREFSIGYRRSSAIVEALEREGVVSAPDQFGKRDVMVDEQGQAK